jgi:hypothetical protein
MMSGTEKMRMRHAKELAIIEPVDETSSNYLQVSF